MFLTFDDGPTPEITEWVIEQLAEYDQEGTFFCIGANVVKHPAIFDAIQKNGHRVGNHTFNHVNGFRTGLDDYLENIEKAAEIIESDLFRAPYGRISRNQARRVSKNYEIVQWSIISRDYYNGLNQKKALKALKRHTKPGSIVVFHDSEKAWENLKFLLPEYLEFLKESKLKSVAL